MFEDLFASRLRQAGATLRPMAPFAHEFGLRKGRLSLLPPDKQSRPAIIEARTVTLCEGKVGEPPQVRVHFC